MPYLFVFLKKQQNLKLSSVANHRWRFKGKLCKKRFIHIVLFVLMLNILVDNFSVMPGHFTVFMGSRG